MKCERTDTVLHCYHDKELDPLRAAHFERHLEECAECLDALEGLESLRSTINVAQLYAGTPDPLRKTILASLTPSGPRFAVPARKSWGWLALAATLLLFAFMGWQFSLRRAGNNETLLASEVVDAHIRSLQPGHLTDVVSSDQHTVKPWFNGKLDFSPPVRDLTDLGFPLKGGRLDVLHGRTVAALVYGRRKHLVNVLIWPVEGPDVSPRAGSRLGYHWLDWRKGGLELCAVSDAAPSDLEQLQRAIAQ
jgi:anti-sigma factor RsiW